MITTKESWEKEIVEKSARIVLDTGALFCLVKNIREYRKSVGLDGNSSIFLYRLKVEEELINSILNHGSDFPFNELDKVKEYSAQSELRKQTLEMLKDEEE